MPKQKKMWDNILTVIMSVLCLLWIYPIVLILLNSLKIRLWNTRTGPSGNSCKKHANNPGLKIQSLFCWVTMGNW